MGTTILSQKMQKCNLGELKKSRKALSGFFFTSAPHFKTNWQEGLKDSHGTCHTIHTRLLVYFRVPSHSEKAKADPFS